jgi:Aspartyl protease
VRAIVLLGMMASFSLNPAAAADRGRAEPVADLSIDQRGGIVVPVTVGGAGPFRFILDTGATRSLVGDDLAGLLHAPLVARAELVTSAGSEMQGVVRLARVEVAGARAESLLASVLPAARLRALASGVRGVLGQDFLSAFNYTLDYRRRRLIWDEPGDVNCGAPSALRLIPAEGRYVVVLSPIGLTRALRLVPDTGAEAFVFFHAPGEAAPAMAIGSARLTGLSGDRGVRAASAPHLVVGGITLRDQAAVIVDRLDETADGLLPLHGFASVSFNMRDACMVVRGTR